MAGGKEVGRVQIRVLPDSSNFGAELKRKLQQIERTAKVTIKTALDTSGLAGEAKRAAAAASKSAKVTLSTALDSKGVRKAVSDATKNAQDQAAKATIKAPLDIDTERGWQERVTREVKAAAARLEAQIPLTVDGERMRADLAKTVKSATDNLNATIPVDAEQAAAFRSKVQGMVDQIESRAAELKIAADTAAARRDADDLQDSINGRSATFNVDADTGVAAARLATLTRDRIVTIHVRLSAGSVGKITSALAGLSGARVAADAIHSIGNAMSNLDRAVPKVAALATSFTNLGAAALAGTSNILALAGSVASIAPAALAVPGIFAGIAVGATTMVLALKDAGKVLADLGPQFSALQDSISSSFWAKAEAPIRNLATSVLPLLETQLSAVSSSIGTFFAGLAQGLSSDLSLSQLGTQMDYLKQSIDIAAGSAEPLVRAFMTLGTVGASYLPQLATWFTDLTTQFDAFITKAAGDGSLTAWIDGGIQAMQDLGRVVANATGILGGFASAAANAGGASLGALADGLERVNAAINGPVWQGALTTVFQGAHDAMAALTPGVSALGDAFISLAPTIAQVMTLAGQAGSALLQGLGAALQDPVFQSGATAMFQGILTGVQALQPAFPALGEAAGALMSVLGTLASTIGPVLGTAVQQLAPVFTALMTAIQPLIPVLGQALVTAISALAPLLVTVAEGIANFTNAFPGLSAVIAVVAAALVALLPVIISVISGIVGFATTIAGAIASFGGLAAVTSVLGTAFSVLGPVIAAVAAVAAVFVAGLAALAAMFAYAWSTSEPFRAAVMGLGQAFMGLVSTVAGALMPILTALAGAVFPALMTVVNALVPVFTLVIQIVTQVITILTSLVTFILGMLMPVFQAILPVITTVFSAIASIITAAIGIVQGILTAFLGLLQGNWSMVWQGLSMIVQSVWALIVAIVTGAIAIVQSIITAGLTLITSIWSTVWNGLVSIATSIWGAITSAVSTAISTVQSVISSGLSAAQGIVSGILSGILSFFVSIWSSITSAVSTAISTVQAVISAGMSAALSIVSGIMSGILSVVSSVWSSITSTVSAAASAVVSTVSAGFNAALSAVSSVMSGIISAVTSGVSSVVSGFTSMVSQGISVLTGMIGQAASIGGQIIAGLANAISSGASAVVGAISNVVSGAISAAKSALGIHSPSRVFRGIGEFTVAGLTKGLTGKASEAKKASADLAKGITQVYQKNAEDQRKRLKRKSILGDPKAQAKAFYDTYARASTDALQKLAAKRDGLLKRLDDQKKKLDDLYKARDDKAASLKDQYMGSFDLKKSASGGIQGMIRSAKDAAAAIHQMRVNIWKLKTQGFSQNMINDIGAMDPADANKVAAQILRGTKAQKAALKKQYSSLQSQSAGAGKLVANYMYSTGIQAANGLISGLRSQLAAVDVASKVLADRLVGTVRKRLGIHSPSRVMAVQGRFSAEGFAKGLRDNAHLADMEMRSLMAAPPAPNVAAGQGGSGAEGPEMDMWQMWEQLLAALASLRLSVDGRELHTTIKVLEQKFARR
ncbi:phage tail protein [Kocuria rhizophila]|uniref:phage tail protein n=1 Tax=Kocuria rhizophila TaxID=72000 RepID=UPI0021A4B7CF|nr:hypothetical protein [Kocuria rhizophila]MCT2249369.1 hypothetical protein [Kocuria rhizophila]